VTNTRDDKVGRSPGRRASRSGDVFSFMTTLPNTLTATINHERCPVLVTEEEQLATWLTGTPEEAFGLIKTSDPERMQIVQSGFEKKDLQQAA
jgi:putative SOS response-associated peptidase YedK